MWLVVVTLCTTGDFLVCVCVVCVLFDFRFAHARVSRSCVLRAGIKCPVCNKFVLPDDIECHLVMCLTKPRLSYNGECVCAVRAFHAANAILNGGASLFAPAEDVLTDAKGECVICLEDLNCGDLIARLPCLCVYHKG